MAGIRVKEDWRKATRMGNRETLNAANPPAPENRRVTIVTLVN